MYTKQQAHAMATVILDILGKNHVVASRCCLDCLHFNEKADICGKWNARPPARVIVNGCDDFKDDIPF